MRCSSPLSSSRRGGVGSGRAVSSWVGCSWRLLAPASGSARQYQASLTTRAAIARPSTDRSRLTSAGSAWEANRATAATDGSAARAVLTSPEAPARLATNIKYFLVGRHFGFIPYFFPGAVAIVVWLLSSARRDVWRMLTFGAFVASAIGLLLLMPYTWSGGGGPIGNRYFLSIYPVLFFLMPPVDVAQASVDGVAGRRVVHGEDSGESGSSGNTSLPHRASTVRPGSCPSN